LLTKPNVSPQPTVGFSISTATTSAVPSATGPQMSQSGWCL
jgi:hypothetical protein